MSDLLLLLLRVLAILFIIAALARPLLPVSWLGDAGPRAIFLILDTSLSTSLVDGNTTVHARMQEKAGKLLDQLTPSDSIQVIVARETPVFLTSHPVDGTPEQIQRLRRDINALEPTLGTANFPAAIQKALAAEEDLEKMARIITVIADDQAHGWSLDDATIWDKLQQQIDLAKIPTIINLDRVQGTDISIANISIDHLQTTRTVTAVNQAVAVEAIIHNRGTAASTGGILHWYANDVSLGISTVGPIPVGSKETVSMNHRFESSGVYDIWCELDVAEPLKMDNSAHLVFTVTDDLPVLVVDGSQLTDPLTTDIGYLMASLGAVGASEERQSPTWNSGFSPKVISPGELATLDLTPYRTLVLANPRRLDEDTMRRLQDYVYSGGGLFLALGDGITTGEFNDTWYRNGVGLSPLPALSVIGDLTDRETFSHLQPPSQNHLATQLLADLQRLDIDRVQVFRRHQFDELVALDTSILLKLEHGDAFAIENNSGKGRCIILGAPLGLAWSNLPICQSYVALVHEWLWYLATPSFPQHNLTLGERIELGSQDFSEDSAASIVRPDHRSAELLATEDNVLSYSNTTLPGLYTVSTGTSEFPYYINRDAGESDLNRIDETVLARVFQHPSFKVHGNGFELAQDLDIEIPTTPIASTLLLILLAVVAGELGLAAWCTHQRHPKMTSVSMQG